MFLQKSHNPWVQFFIQKLPINLFLYFIVGGVAACIDFGLFFLFEQKLGWHFLIAGTVGFVIATLANYFLSIAIVFKSGQKHTKGKEIWLVFLVSTIGLLLTQFVLWVCIEQLGYHSLIAKLIATAAVFFWNYWARKHFVFAKKKYQ